MSRKTEIVTAVSTLGCALGIGFIMQNGEGAQSRYGVASVSAISTVPIVGQPAVLKPAAAAPQNASADSLNVEEITLTSARIDATAKTKLEDLMVKTAVPTDDVEGPASSDFLIEAKLENPSECTVSAAATSSAAATLEYSLDAPCFANNRVTVSHSGLTFSALLSETGRLDLLIPALSEKAEITTAFPNGEIVKASADIDTLSIYDRVVVQWRGDTGVQVHAREYDANYGEDGHVWIGAARDRSVILEGRGGYLTRLGDSLLENGLMAEVYTFPSALMKMEGAVDLTIETEVTKANCGQKIKAHAMQFMRGKALSSQVLTLAVPDCDTIGSFLVLNNLLQDLTVASK